MLPLPSHPRSVPLGATPVSGGSTFRVWAPAARSVYLLCEFNRQQVREEYRLAPVGDGTWAGFAAGIGLNHRYRFHVVGRGSAGPKRDPRARQLSFQPTFPACDCVVRNPWNFPWHTTGWRPPAFNDLILYQLHVGTFRVRPGSFRGKFLDVAAQVPHFAALGITGLQLMPVVEFATPSSLGYNGTDYFSPENDYAEESPAVLAERLPEINRLFAERGQPGYANASVLAGADNQLRALIDLCHVWGIAVLFDVVYNHAGGFYDDDFSVYFLDRETTDDPNNSLYFTEQGWAGGPVFAYWKDEVRQFLIDHAVQCLQEYRVDGLRFDEVSVMDRFGGWRTCQDLVSTARFLRPEVIHIAEYWPVNPHVVRPVDVGGAGFDATWDDGLRDSVRALIGQCSGGAGSSVDLGPVAAALESDRLGGRWRAVRCLENHDVVKEGEGPRLPRLADGTDPRSWFGRSRSRVATGLLLTAPGIPMLFMGQELLEERSWTDNPAAGRLPRWAELAAGDPVLRNHFRCVADLVALRRREPALRGECGRVTHADNVDRVLAFHRWIEGVGADVLIVLNLREQTWRDYRIGFPAEGLWFEVFNSDAYEEGTNRLATGNGGGIWANAEPRHGFPASAPLVIPANGLLVFRRGW